MFGEVKEIEIEAYKVKDKKSEIFIFKDGGLKENKKLIGYRVFKYLTIKTDSFDIKIHAYDNENIILEIPLFFIEEFSKEKVELKNIIPITSRKNNENPLYVLNSFAAIVRKSNWIKKSKEDETLLDSNSINCINYMMSKITNTPFYNRCMCMLLVMESTKKSAIKIHPAKGSWSINPEKHKKSNCLIFDIDVKKNV